MNRHRLCLATHGFILLMQLIAAESRGCCAGTNDAFGTSVEAFQAGHFAEASIGFRGLLERGAASGTLLNLGLTEWRRGRAGSAILAWEQARWIDPFDGRASANLDYARNLTGVESPDLTWYERTSTQLPASAWAWIVTGSLWLSISLTVLPGIFRWRKSAWSQALAALGLAVFFASLPAHCGIVARTRIGFVLQKDAALRLTPTAEAEVVAKLSAGEPARELRRHGDDVLIRTAQGRGWIGRSQFGRVCPE